HDLPHHRAHGRRQPADRAADRPCRHPRRFLCADQRRPRLTALSRRQQDEKRPAVRRAFPFAAEEDGGWRPPYSGSTASACRPFWPCTTVKLTFWPSFRLLNPWVWIARKWTKTSSPFSRLMNPKPLASLNHLTVPVSRSDI